MSDHDAQTVLVIYVGVLGGALSALTVCYWPQIRAAVADTGRALVAGMRDLGSEIRGWFVRPDPPVSVTYASDRSWPEGVAAARASMEHFNRIVMAAAVAEREARDMDKVAGHISRAVQMPVVRWEADNDDMVTVMVGDERRQLSVAEAERFAYGVLAASVEARHSARANTATDPAGTASDVAI